MCNSNHAEVLRGSCLVVRDVGPSDYPNRHTTQHAPVRGLLVQTTQSDLSLGVSCVLSQHVGHVDNSRNKKYKCCSSHIREYVSLCHTQCVCAFSVSMKYLLSCHHTESEVVELI